jgi:hypothetical protein
MSKGFKNTNSNSSWDRKFNIKFLPKPQLNVAKVVHGYKEEPKKYICYRGVKTKMDISVIYDDETEAEFELEFCCASCAVEQWGWTVNQFSRAYNRAVSSEPIRIPNNVKTLTEFKTYLKNL